MNQWRIVTSPNETVICCFCLLMIGVEVSSLQPPGVPGEKIHSTMLQKTKMNDDVHTDGLYNDTR